MDNPSCTTTPPETILSLLWTTVAVFGIVYAILGYRCLRAIGFLSGLAAGTGFVLWLQTQHVELVSKQADSGTIDGKKFWKNFHVICIATLKLEFPLFSPGYGCWSLWCCIGFNPSHCIGAGMCICRCYHKRIDHHILHRNASESRIWCKYYRVNQANNRSEEKQQQQQLNSTEIGQFAANLFAHLRFIFACGVLLLMFI